MTTRPKAIPLTPEQNQLLKDIKRINERIVEVAKEYGTESYAYEQYYAALKNLLPERHRRFRSDGIIQISRSNEMLLTAGSPGTVSSIERILGKKTKGQLKREARKDLKSEGIKKPTPAQIQERAKAIDEIRSFVESNRDMFYIKDKRAQEIAGIRGRKKTYSELLELKTIYQGNATIEYKDIFEGL